MADDANEARKQFEARLDLLKSSGYLPVFEKMVRSMCAPFWWSSRHPADPLALVRQNGTICFIDTGGRQIGVTADHVYQGYLDDKKKYPNVECQFRWDYRAPDRSRNVRHISRQRAIAPAGVGRDMSVPT